MAKLPALLSRVGSIFSIDRWTDSAFTLTSKGVETPKHPESQELVYGRIIIRAAKLLMRYIQRLEVVVMHHERIPAEGGALLAVNHTGYWDFVYGGIPAHFRGGRLVRFMAKKEIWDNKFAKPPMEACRHIPVDRADGQASVNEAIERLKAGELVGIFPEATISRSFEVKELRQGATIISRDSGAPLIPMAIWGSQRIWTKGGKNNLRPKNAKLVISVGEPVEVTEDSIETTERLHEAMKAQLDEAQQEYVRRYGPMPKGEAWVPARFGGSAPTLEEATAKDRADQAERKRKREQQAQQDRKN